MPDPSFLPTSEGNDRLHIKLHKMRNDLRAQAARVSSITAGWFQANLQANRTSDAGLAEEPAAAEEEEEGEDGGEVATRVDFLMQVTTLEATTLNEYLSAIQAHTQYFENGDIVHFLSNCHRHNRSFAGSEAEL